MSDHDQFRSVVFSPEGLHRAVTTGYAHGKTLFLNGSKSVLVTVGEGVEPVTLLQRKFFHGPILSQISEQVSVKGERFTAAIWKRHLKDVILERVPKFEMVKLPGAKRATPRRVRRSTESLGVKAYAKFIDECIDYATLEWGVTFVFERDEREAVRYRPRGKSND